MTKDQEREQVRERLEFLEGSIRTWSEWRLKAPAGEVRRGAEAQLLELEREYNKTRARYHRLRSELTLPW